MTTTLTFDHEAELLASADDVRACLIDPATVLRCVPGATQIHVTGSTVRSCLRIKLEPIPMECLVEAWVSAQEQSEDVLTVEGHASDRRSGTATHFRCTVVVLAVGTGQARCRLTGELDGVHEDSTAVPAQALVDRLFVQFARRLEELSNEPADLAEAKDSVEDADSAARTTGRQQFSSRSDRVLAAASAGATAGRKAGRMTGRWIARRVRSAANRR